MNSDLKTPEQIKAELARQGRSAADLARQHGFQPNDIYKVLNGFMKCKRGKGHAIAIALGMKDGERV